MFFISPEVLEFHPDDGLSVTILTYALCIRIFGTLSQNEIECTILFGTFLQMLSECGFIVTCPLLISYHLFRSAREISVESAISH